MMYLRTLVLAALVALQVTAQTTEPGIVAYVLRNSHPSFTALTDKPDFSPVVQLFGKYVTEEKFYSVTFTFVDKSIQVLLVKVRAYSSGNKWQLISTYYPGKEISTITVAPLSSGSQVPIVVVQ